jgi:hypothetical protein
MNKHRVAALLANGLNQLEVATIIGVSPAAICQVIKNDEPFKLLLADYQTKAEKEDSEDIAIDARYVSAEHALVKSVIAQADGAELRDAVAALRVISERNLQIRRGLSKTTVHGEAATGQVNVVINLPAHTISTLQQPEVHINGEQEVVAIGTDSIAPMPSKSVSELFKRLRGEGHGSKAIKESGSPTEAIPTTEAISNLISMGV